MRERLLDAALALLRESGIQRLTQVQVARRAGVRQSHLTYYFPTRTDLLDATATRFVDWLTASLDRTVRNRAAGGARGVLAQLAKAITEPGHMRMFIGLVVAADQEPELRPIIFRGTQRVEAALADALGGADRVQGARVVLAALWGLGLYRLAMDPASRNDPIPTALVWLETSLQRSLSS